MELNADMKVMNCKLYNRFHTQELHKEYKKYKKLKLSLANFFISLTLCDIVHTVDTMEYIMNVSEKKFWRYLRSTWNNVKRIIIMLISENIYIV